MSAFWNGFGQGFGFGFGFNFMNWCCNPFFMGYGIGMSMSMPTFGGWGMPSNNYYVPNYSGQSIYDYSPAGGGGVSGNFDELTLTKTGNGEVTTEEPKSEQPKVSKEAQALYDIYNRLDGVSSDLTPEFCDKVIEVANNVNCQPEDLMAIMYAESRFDHTSESLSNDNKDRYVGLIRFKHNDRDPNLHDDSQEILGFGVNVSGLKKMSAIEQLEYVEKYIMARKSESNSSAELKLEDLAAMICTTENEYAKKGTAAYSNNKWFDGILDDKKKKDKTITQDELIEGLKTLKCSTWDK